MTRLVISTMIAMMLLAITATGAYARVITIAQYRCGEDDRNATAKGIIPRMFPYQGADSGPNANHLVTMETWGNAISWSDDVPPAWKLPLGPSTHSYRFKSGYIGKCLKGDWATRLTDTVGIELWVKTAVSDQQAVIALNGKRSAPGDGFEFFQYGTYFNAELINEDHAGKTPVKVNEWMHLALVTDMKAWGESRFYVNGSQVGASQRPPRAPQGKGAFQLGGNMDTTKESFDGWIDEVRLFTFKPGEFNVSDLNYSEVPEPGAVALLIPITFIMLGEIKQRAVRRLKAVADESG